MLCGSMPAASAARSEALLRLSAAVPSSVTGSLDRPSGYYVQ